MDALEERAVCIANVEAGSLAAAARRTNRSPTPAGLAPAGWTQEFLAGYGAALSGAGEGQGNGEACGGT